MSLVDVDKTYGSDEVAVHSVRGVSLAVPAGQFNAPGIAAGEG